MNRREERETAFYLIFERAFNTDISAEDFYNGELDERKIDDTDYIRKVFFETEEKKSELDAAVEKYFMNWKRNRISRVSEAILRLAAYEIIYCNDIPSRVSINEAIELSKKFDDEKTKTFVNGVLNALAKERESGCESENERK